MAIWAGINGGLRIEQAATGKIYANITPSDVDAEIDRFGLDKPVSNLFITGDRVEIARVDANGNAVTSQLDFVAAEGWPDNRRHPDGAWFVNVDLVGGIRLYDELAQSVSQ